MAAVAIDGPSDRAILSGASESAARIDACRRLITPVFKAAAAQEPISGAPKANLDAMKRFVLSTRDARSRFRCARYLANVQTVAPEAATSEYARAANRIVLTMFQSPNPQVRTDAANALWGTRYPQNGGALLWHALHDRSPTVAAASFRNLVWPMRADIVVSHGRAAYAAAITQGLKSKNDGVVGAALSAYAALYQSTADAFLRRYALDKRDVVRLGAIDAYDLIGQIRAGMVPFIESRLSDSSPVVRKSVMLQLFRWGDHHAMAEIERLSKTAPTAKERSLAREYADALKKQP